MSSRKFRLDRRRRRIILPDLVVGLLLVTFSYGSSIAIGEDSIDVVESPGFASGQDNSQQRPPMDGRFYLNNGMHRVEAFVKQLCGKFQSPPGSLSSGDEQQQPFIATTTTSGIVENDNSTTTTTTSRSDEQPAARLRILKGKQAQLGQFPSYVRIEAFGSKTAITDYICGGTLVASDLVVTAAHCVDTYVADTIRIRAGFVKNRQMMDAETQVANVNGFCRHYKHGTLGTSPIYDLAVLQLDRKLTFTDRVRPVCLEFDRNYLPKGDNKTADAVYMVGFGHVDQEHLSTELNYLRMRRAKCIHGGREVELDQATSCYKPMDPASKPCPGDSGSGLYLIRNNQQFLIGFVSAGLLGQTTMTGERDKSKMCKTGPDDITFFYDIFKGQYELMRLLKFCYEPGVSKEIQ